MTKKVAVFFHPYFSDGGVERTNIFLGKGLVELGYEVVFLTTNATWHYRNEVESYNIKIKEFGGRSVSGCLLKLFRYLWRLSGEKSQIYFVSCQYYVNVISMLIAISLKPFRRNIKFINSERNHLQEYNYRTGLKFKVIPVLVKILYRFADVILANSKETSKDLAQLINRSVRCVYNPTINDRIDYLRKENVTEKWFVDDPRPCILAVGRLSFQKDHMTLLRAFKTLKQDLDCKLVILGEGEQRSNLESYIHSEKLSNDVYLPGFVDNPYKFIAASKVFVLSSVYEGLPNALIEAVYLAVPCVSTRCKSGPEEVLLDGEGGILVDVKDSEAMSVALKNVLSDTKSASDRAAVALMNVKRFTAENSVKEFVWAINTSG